MAVDIIFKFDDSEAIEGIDRVLDRLGALKEELKGVESGSEKMSNSIASDSKKATAAIKDKVNATKQDVEAITEAQQANRSFSESIKDQALSIRIGSRTLGEHIDGWKKYVDSQKRVQSEAAKTNVAMTATQRLTASLSGTIRGALVGSLGLAVGAFAAMAAIAGGAVFVALTRTQKGMDLLERKTTGLKFATDELTGRIAKLGETFLKTYQSGGAGAVIQGFAATVRDAFRGIINDTKEAIKLGEQYAAKFQSLQKEQLAFERDSVGKKLALSGAKATFSDSSGSIGSRRVASRQITEIELERINFDILQLRTRIELEDKVAAQQKENGLENSETLQKQIELQQQLEDLRVKRSEIIRDEKEREKQLTEEIKKQRDLKKQQNEEAKRLIESTFAPLLQVEAAADPLTALKAERRQAISGAEDVRTRLLQLGKSKAETDQIIQNYLDFIELKYRDGLVKLARNIAEESDQKNLSDEILQSLQNKQSNLLSGVQIQDQRKRSDRSPFENLEFDIADILGFESIEDFRLFSDQVVSGVSSIAAALDSLNQAEIEQQDAIISRLQRSIELKRQDYEDEKRLKEEGLANNADLKKRELDTLIKQEEAAIQKREQLEQKAAKRRLAIEAAQQTASTVSAVINLLASETRSKGIIGIAIALAGMAAIFGIIAQAKAQARKATKFEKGGKLKGLSHASGGIPVGETGIEVEGEEFIINKRDASEHEKFIEKLNKGAYRGVDLEGIVGAASGVEANVRRFGAIQEKIARKEAKDKQEALIAAYRQETSRLISFFESRPERVPVTAEGYIEFLKSGDVNVKRRVKIE